MADLSIEIGSLRLKNPVIAASGTFGYGLEFAPYFDLSLLGGFVVKGLYPNPREGNPPPRLAETPAGLLNAIGLQGIGVRAFAAEILPRLRDFDTAVIVNVCGEDEDEYAAVIDALAGEPGLAAFELNISCPNVRKEGLCPALFPDTTHALVRMAKERSPLPIITKLSPNVTSVVEIARAAEAAGTDAIALVNTFLAMAVDVETRRPRLANTLGGLSGPAIKPIALRMVYQVAAAVRVPVIGLGGIATAEDALEFLIAGARAVQVGTANFIDPRACPRIVEGLDRFCEARGVARVADLVGTLRAA